MTPLEGFRSESSPKRTLAAVKDYAKLCQSQGKPMPAHLKAVLGEVSRAACSG